MEYFHLNCQCTDVGCLIRVVKDDGVYINVQLNHYLPWWRRVIEAVRYVRGKDSAQCHWGETVVTEVDRAKLVEFLSR